MKASINRVLIVLLAGWASQGIAWAGCNDVYYKITIGDVDASAKQTRIDDEAKRTGGFGALVERDERDRNTLVNDQTMSATIKRKVIPWLDSNIQAARCWKALM